MTKTIIMIAAAVSLAAANAATADVIDACRTVSPEKGGTPVELVLPVKGSGVLDFHFRMGASYARSGGDTAAVAVCKVGEEGETAETRRPILATVYRAKVRSGVATVMVEMPGKEGASSLVSVVVGTGKDRAVYHGRLVSGSTKVQFGGATPETSWKPE